MRCWTPVARAGLARILARASQADEARRLLGELQAEADRTAVYSPEVAWVLLALDEVEGALAWLERAYRQRHPQLRLTTSVARVRNPRLAADPRYLELRRGLGLPP